MDMLTLEDKKALLHIARSAIENYLSAVDGSASGGKDDIFDEFPLTEALQATCGAFVTIKNKGELCGCIGLISSNQPLYKTVEEMAVSAAFRDTRFSPVSLRELPDIDLEISVLSPFRPIKDVSEIEIGKHGLFIIQPPFQGLLLPQVATENNWDRQTFIKHTCFKAGLPAQAWKEKDTIIEIFSAEVFGEKDM